MKLSETITLGMYRACQIDRLVSLPDILTEMFILNSAMIGQTGYPVQHYRESFVERKEPAKEAKWDFKVEKCEISLQIYY